MNTLDDLRATLAQQADLADHRAAARPAEVASRVRGVRRRRAAAVAGVAAVALIGAATVAFLPDTDRQVEPAELLGLEVPETLTSLGYTYEYVRGVEADAPGAAGIELEPSDDPRLVTWATAGESQDVSVTQARGPGDFESSRPDFTDYVWVSPDHDDRIRVTSESEPVAIAVYELAGPPGGAITTAEHTFRPELPAHQLLAGRIGEPGEHNFSVTFPMPRTGILVSTFCHLPGMTAPGSSRLEPVEVMVDIPGEREVGGGTISAGGCADHTVGAAWRDRNMGGGEWELDEFSEVGSGRPSIRPGDEVTLRVSVDPVLSGDESVVGIAVYERTVQRQEIFPDFLGAEREVEFDGHLWRLASWEVADLADRDWSTRVPMSEERVLVGSLNATESNGGAVFLHVGDQQATGTSGLQGGSVGVGTVVPPDAGPVRFVTEGKVTGRAAVLFYELVR